MAEAFFNHASETERVISTGFAPDKEIHPTTVQIMREESIDVSQKKPKQLTEETMAEAGRIVVMDTEALAVIPAEYLWKTENWDIGKLIGRSIEHARKMRDEIMKRVYQMVDDSRRTKET